MSDIFGPASMLGTYVCIFSYGDGVFEHHIHIQATDHVAAIREAAAITNDLYRGFNYGPARFVAAKLLVVHND